jgi:hypothetical protein
VHKTLWQQARAHTRVHLLRERRCAHELAAHEHSSPFYRVAAHEAIAVKGVRHAVGAVVEVAGAVAEQRAAEVGRYRALHRERCAEGGCKTLRVQLQTALLV